jgi:hypothetical protein
MAPPTQPVIQFRRPQKPLTYSDSLAAGPFGYPGPPYTVAHLVEKMTTQFIDRSYVLMHAVTWFFPNCEVKGIPGAQYVPRRCEELDGVDSPWGYLGRGYRCEECNLVFFGNDLDDFHHSCMEVPA